jgi:predicted small metal-binding protein
MLRRGGSDPPSVNIRGSVILRCGQDTLVIRMTLMCYDVGYNCPFVVQGESERERVTKMHRHLCDTHRCDVYYVERPELVATLKACIDAAY